VTQSGFMSLVVGSVKAWLDDFAPSMGAALAYYTLFAIAPVLIIVIAVAGAFLGADAARGQIVEQLGSLVGPDGARAVQSLLQTANQPARTAVASLIGVVTLIVAATSVFAELQTDLDRIWRAPAPTAGQNLIALVRTRVLSFGMIMAIGFLLLVSLVISAFLAAIGRLWGSWFAGWDITLQVVNVIVSLAVTTALFALIYKILPRVRVAWKDVWAGAAVTAVLFTVGKFAIGLYIGRAGISSTFGAAGSLVVIMVWVYYSAQIFLLGAEFTWLFAHRHGSRADRHAEAPEPPRSPDELMRPGPAVPSVSTTPTRHGSP
jgi:membrane protein